MNILYGCCYYGLLFNGEIVNDVNIDYVDIIPFIDKPNGDYICSDIRNIDFNKYDIIILSPPCNYYSRANYRRESSVYSQMTKDLLSFCLNIATRYDIPVIVENVRNFPLFKSLGFFNNGLFCYIVGRHTYWTNQLINPILIPQKKESINFIGRYKRQGGYNVEQVFNYFLKIFVKNS